MATNNYINGKKKRNVNSRKNLDMVSLQLHNVYLTDDENASVIDDIIKTYNSVVRCSSKHFQNIGLNNLMKSKTPTTRKGSYYQNFTNWNHRESPCGMSDKMWEDMRKESYLRKMEYGLSHANKFWQLDKDIGSPISGTITTMKEWVKSHGYTLDSTLIHDAVMSGYKTYISFDKKNSRFQTSKSSPVFGDMVSRSKKHINSKEFQLTRNSSITVVGKTKVGNPKFKFDLEKNTMTFTYNYKKIEFSFKKNRFSKIGWDKFYSITEFMNNGKLPVTVTLKKIGQNQFNVSLTYSPNELSSLMNEYISHKDNIVCAIYTTDEVLCHQVIDKRKHKVLHEKIHFIDELNGEKKNRHEYDRLQSINDLSGLDKLKKRIRNKTFAASRELLTKIFNINRSYGVKEVVVESAKSRNSRNFNKSLIEFNQYNIGRNANNCFISHTKFNELVKGHCARNGMKFKKVNGTFNQMLAILQSNTMTGALRNACSSLVSINEKGFHLDLTECVKYLPNPSMLDWVGHLLHNKMSRQAGMEIRKMFQSMVVEKATSLLDKRFKCNAIEKGRHSPMNQILF